MMLDTRKPTSVEIKEITEIIRDNFDKITEHKHGGKINGGLISCELGSIKMNWHADTQAFFAFQYGTDRIDFYQMEEDMKELREQLIKLEKIAKDKRGTGQTLKEATKKYLP